MQAIGSGYQNYNTFGNNSLRPHGSNYNLGPRGQQEDNDVQNFAVTAGGLGVVSLLIHKASEFLAQKMSAGDEFASEENVHKVANTMLEKNGLQDTVKIRYIDHQNKFEFGPEFAKQLEPVARGQNAFYMDSAKIAVAPKTKPSLMLHELGHAINSSKGQFLRFLQKSRGWAMAVPAALFALNGLLGKNKDGKENFVEKNAGLIGFSAFLPTIIEEGMASWRGIKAAREVLGSSANLKVLKRNYALAWGTYVLAGVGLGVAAKQSVIQ